MQIHKNSALTPKQREQVHRLYKRGNHSISALATKFGVNRKTIAKWANRTAFGDQKSQKVTASPKLTTAFLEDVKAYRLDPLTSYHGKVRIAHELSTKHPCSNPSNVYLALKRLGLNRPLRRNPKPVNPLPVGKHRTQMDIQQLPAIEGKEGFEYKISIIHLSTRLKYSEIHDDAKSKTIAGVYQRALEQLPPFSSPLPTMPCASPWNTLSTLNGRQPSLKLWNSSANVSMHSSRKAALGGMASSSGPTGRTTRTCSPKCVFLVLRRGSSNCAYGKWSTTVTDRIKELSIGLLYNKLKFNTPSGCIRLWP